MSVLVRVSSQQVLLSELTIAESLFARMRGLLCRTGLSENQGMWIKPCNSIHTFFMNFAIDCVFLDRDMQICSVIADIAPWRLTRPRWNAHSVVEMQAGRARALGLSVGEKLHVGD